MRSTISDPDTNRNILIGDGVIPQVEAFASKYTYVNRPTISMEIIMQFSVLRNFGMIFKVLLVNI